MTSRGTKYWNSGAIPLIAPEILGDIIAEVADVGVVISETGADADITPQGPATGLFSRHVAEQKKLVAEALKIG